MEKECINIWPGDKEVHLTAFFDPHGSPKPAVIVLPGGGYHFCAPREGEPAARRFAGMGYAAFLLEYSTLYGSYCNSGGAENPHAFFPEPLLELAAAIRFIKDQATRFNADPERIFLLGFSAGGHLAACYSCMWNSAELFNAPLRPSACVLVYAATEPEKSDMMLPVVRAGDMSRQQLDRFTPKKLAGPQTPPTILFHSAGDPMVPVSESLDYFAALRDHNVLGELHILAWGSHAYGLGEGQPMGIWPQLADNFLRSLPYSGKE